jgi:GNAT superfamily N-acetyltransferase
MSHHSIDIRPAEHRDLPAVVVLVEQQAQRHNQQNALLPSRHLRAEQLKRLTQQLSTHKPLVAVNQEGDVRGYVCPNVWSLSEHSLLHAYLTARNGIASMLTLPTPHEEDALAVAEALLNTLTSFWRQARTTGELIRWPSHDRWLMPILITHGFVLDSICALHALSWRSLEPAEVPPPYLIRSMTPADVERVVALFEEELRYHVQHGLFASVTPVLLSAFRAKVERSLNPPEEAGQNPLVLVAHEAEAPSGLVAMLVAEPLHISAEDEPGWSRPGDYVCIDHLCVAEYARGQGIGRVLTQMAMMILQREQERGYLAWYSAGNPLSSRFWPHMGFTPLWSTYQRVPALLTHPTTKPS